MPKKILVIEDEEELGRSLKKFLEQHGYLVTYFNEVIREGVIRVENPDLIITDLLMPHIHGFDICKKVKNDPDLKNIPLIAMTAVYKDYFHKMEAMRIGVEAFLEKPIKFSDLLGKIRELLGEESPEESGVTDAPKAPEVHETPGVMAASPGAGIKSNTAEAPLTITKKEVSAAPPASPPKPTSPPDNRDTANKIKTDKEKERDDIIQGQFQVMQQDYVSALPVKIKEVEELWDSILSPKNRQNIKELLAEFRRKVHSISGSGPTFGFPDFGEFAAQLEVLSDMIIAEGENTISRRKNKINELLDKLRHHPIVSTELDVMRQEGKI